MASITQVDAEGEVAKSQIKGGDEERQGQVVDDEGDEDMNGIESRPKQYSLCGVRIPAYSHPQVQTGLMGMILFLTVGMYSVTNNLGGVGQKTAYLSDVSNLTLYAVFAFFCLIAPACLNYFTLRTSLCFGGIGYSAYVASLWCYNHTSNTGFVIFGGAWNGLSAAFLWPAITTAILSYATECKKGRYVTIYWTIFNLGIVLGGIVPLVLNWNAGVNNKSRVNDGTYIAFLVLTLLGSVLGLALYPWQRMVREDGTRVSLGRHQTFREEILVSLKVLREHKWIVFFVPFCWCNYQWFIYQNNKLNGIVFTVRARSLNIITNSIANILAAWIINPLLDNMPFKRRKRAFIGLAYIFTIYNAVCIGGYWAWKDTRIGLDEAQRLDIYDHNYGWWCFLFTMYGFVSGSYNVYAHWFIGALSNDPVQLSVYNSMYILIAALSQMTDYAIDFSGGSKGVLFFTMWAYIAAGPIFLLPIIKYWMLETNNATPSANDASCSDVESERISGSTIAPLDKQDEKSNVGIDQGKIMPESSEQVSTNKDEGESKGNAKDL